MKVRDGAESNTRRRDDVVQVASLSDHRVGGQHPLAMVS